MKRRYGKTVWLLQAALCAVLMILVAADGVRAVAVVDAQLNRWYDIQAPAQPVDHRSMPPLFKEGVRSDQPHVVIYRFLLARGGTYTIQTEHPADYLQGAVNLWGINLLAPSKRYSAPSDATVRILHRNRSFPGGDIKGYTFGNKANFTISPKSEREDAWLVISSKQAGTPYRFRIMSPAEPDEAIKKSGAYRISPRGETQTSYSYAHEKPLWLGYVQGEPRTEGSAAAAPCIGPESRNLFEWIEYLQAGRPFAVVFDATTGKFDDSIYTGDWRTDPMGTIKGGERYTGVFQNGQFSVTGFNQQQGAVTTAVSGGASPGDALLSIWGRVYAFDGKGRVWDPDYGWVGHLQK